jgi:hypothetical protein
MPRCRFLLNILLMIGAIHVVLRLASSMLQNLSGHATIRLALQKRMDVASFEKYLCKKSVENVTTSISDARMLKNVIWNEPLNVQKWRGLARPRVEVQYEHASGMLISVSLQANMRLTAHTEATLMRTILADLALHGGLCEV